jgi:hypothetical protein
MTAYRQFVFMKVGRHAGEDFNAILARKRAELRAAGRIFWGYGGTTCNPTTQVRPFVRRVLEAGGRVHLLMEPIDSRADPDIVPATEYSEDGVHWIAMPSGVLVTGSRYALVLGEIQEEDFELPLHDCEVAAGKRAGTPASDYIRGRVDKACVVRNPGMAPISKAPCVAHIQYSAELLEPYAVFLRGGS